jgi:hypothetical protein
VEELPLFQSSSSWPKPLESSAERSVPSGAAGHQHRLVSTGVSRIVKAATAATGGAQIKGHGLFDLNIDLGSPFLMALCSRRSTGVWCRSEAAVNRLQHEIGAFCD